MKQIYRLRNIFLNISTDRTHKSKHNFLTNSPHFQQTHTHYNQTQIILGGKKKKKKEKKKKFKILFIIAAKTRNTVGIFKSQL